MKSGSSETRKSAFAFARNGTDSLHFEDSDLGHSARPSDRSNARPSAREETPEDSELSPLGEPLNIRQVAALIGCSVWSVRQTLIDRGLPCFRSRPSGRLIFYRDQVVRWILDNQIQARRTNR